MTKHKKNRSATKKRKPRKQRRSVVKKWAKRKKRAPANKKLSKKSRQGDLGKVDDLTLVHGRLVPGPGRPSGKPRLLRFVAEKLPWTCFDRARKHVEGNHAPANGVYLAHDFEGVARYGGRGKVFTRLAQHRKKHGEKLRYFSFYLVAEKNHERELETATIRAAGPLLLWNDRKLALGTKPGDIKDYEPGTTYIEAQRTPGRRKDFADTVERKLRRVDDVRFRRR